jgi:hypothetical protein
VADGAPPRQGFIGLRASPGSEDEGIGRARGPWRLDLPWADRNAPATAAGVGVLTTPYPAAVFSPGR